MVGVDLRVFITIDSSVWVCFCCLWASGDRRAHVWQRYVRAGQVMISELFQEFLSDFDLNRVGYHELVGEIIRLEEDMATIQVAFDVLLWSEPEFRVDLMHRCTRRHQELQLATLSSELGSHCLLSWDLVSTTWNYELQ